jgi:hypothetical protein
MRSVSSINFRLWPGFILVFLVFSSQAQINSPFSRYGIGEYYTNSHIISRAMGGLAASYADGLNNNIGQSINFSNPATYATMYMVSFDIGLTYDTRTLRSFQPPDKYVSSTLLPSYLSLGIPLNRTKNLGLAIGLKPISAINYSVVEREKISSGDSLHTLYEGTGGLNQLFIGVGKKWKDLSIGFNTGFIFGRKEISTIKQFLNDTVSYSQSKSSTTSEIGGMFLSGGLQYELSLRKKSATITRANSENYLLRFGLTGSLKNTVNATQSIDKKTIISSVTGDVRIDSVYEQNDVKGKVVLPSTYAAGVTLHKTVTNTRGVFEMWSIGLEYTSTQWSTFRYYDVPDKLADSWQMKLGVQFSPDPFAGRDYLSKINYRAGAFFGKDYVNADGNGLKQYGLSVGAGLPIRKWTSFDNQFTVMNIAFQLGKRGTTVNTITENYMQVSLGISLSDLWFVKRKYD